MEAVLGVAAGQHGLFTTAQWLEAGFSRRRLTYRKHAGLVLELYPGVFAPAGAPQTFEQQVLALCLSVNGFASHRCAAYLWGFRKFETPTVEVLTGRNHTPALNGALHRRRVSVRKLQATLDRVSPRHPGARRFQELLLPFAEGQSPTESELEDDFLELVIRKFGLPVPVRQHPVGRRSIDFAYPELIFGVEIDSVRGHAAREDVDRNASKANELLEWRIAHFVYDDIHRWPADTAAFLAETIARLRSRLAA